MKGIIGYRKKWNMYIYILSNISSQFIIARRCDETVDALLTSAHHCRRDQLEVSHLGTLGI